MRNPNRTAKEYQNENKLKIAEYKKQYYDDNIEIILEKRKQYYTDNKEKTQQYYIDNKAKINLSKNEKHDCELCGGNYTYAHKSMHLKTKKHCEFVNQILNP